MRKIAEKDKETEEQSQLCRERGRSNIAKYFAERGLAAVRASEAHCIISKRKNKSLAVLGSLLRLLVVIFPVVFLPREARGMVSFA